jgi:riboflavin synthase
MFSGIVEGTAEVKEISVNEKGARITLEVPFKDLNEFPIILGASIAVNGCCLTAVEIKNNFVSFDVINETLRCTNLGLLKQNDSVNVERSLKVGDRIDGHFVSGHVDAALKIVEKSIDGEAISFLCEQNKNTLNFIAPKGSICINGVSLTVSKVTKDNFGFYIIPHTAEITNLKYLNINSIVNVEVDILARYVVNAGLKNNR